MTKPVLHLLMITVTGANKCSAAEKTLPQLQGCQGAPATKDIIGPWYLWVQKKNDFPTETVQEIKVRRWQILKQSSGKDHSTHTQQKLEEHVFLKERNFHGSKNVKSLSLAVRCPPGLLARDKWHHVRREQTGTSCKWGLCVLLLLVQVHTP